MTENAKRSNAWVNFDKVNTNKAVCKLCKAEISIKGGCTKGMLTHVKSKHAKDESKENSATQKSGANDNECDTVRKTSACNLSDNQRPFKKSKITHFFGVFDDNSAEAIVSRMVAKDGIPFRLFCESDDLRCAMLSRGVSLPKSADTVKQMVMKYGNSIEEKICNDLQNRKSKGESFSCTLDEWTSVKFRRYVNINIHTFDSIVYNLGLVRVSGSLSAESCVSLVVNRLEKFQLDVAKDIVSVTTDGAACMVKFGRIMKCEHQECLAHGIHLAVMDTFYTFKSHVQPCKGDEINANEPSDSESSCDEGYLQIENDFECDGKVDRPIILKRDLSDLVSEVRKVIKIISRSTIFKDKLESYIKDSDVSRKVGLVLDTRTRWNSLLAMIERFLLLITEVRKVMIDAGKDINLSTDDICTLGYVRDALKPLELVVSTLCRKDCDLIMASCAITFAYDELQEMHSNNFAKDLLYNLKQRMTHRLRTDLIISLRYLNSAVIGSDIEYSVAKYTIITIAQKLQLDSKYPHISKSDQSNGSSFTESESSTSVRFEGNDRASDLSSMMQRLQNKLHSGLQIPKKDNITFDNVIMKELDYFKITQKRGDILENVFKALKCVQATSVEAERAFSAAAQFVTKVRSRLNDDTISKLCVLRNYFKLKEPLGSTININS